MNKIAQQLGRLAAGKPKKFSEAEIKKRTERIREAQKNRVEKLKNERNIII